MFFHELKNLGRHPDFSTSQTQTSNEVRTRFTQVPETPFMNVSTQVSIKTRNAAIQIDHEKRQDCLDASTQTEFPTNEEPFTTTHKRVILRLFAYIMYQVRIRLAENLDKKKPMKRPVLNQPNKISGLKLKSTQKTPQVIDRKRLNKMIPPAVRIAQEKQIRFMRDHIKRLAELHRLQQNQDKDKQKPILEETHPIDPGHQQKFKKVIKTTKTAESKPFTGIGTNKNKKIDDSIPIRSVLSGSAKPETSKDESSQVGNSIIDNIVKQVESKTIQSESVVKFDADVQTSVRESLVNATSNDNSSTRPEVVSSRTNKSSRRSNNRDTSESSSSSNNSRKPTSETETSKQSESNATESSQTNESTTSRSSEESTSEESSSSSTSKTTNSSKTSSDSSSTLVSRSRSSSASTVSSIPSENVTAPASISSSN
uniref:Uncharacterized protein n=1 Tax=Acrobeloides nanus TaxID=290746 RepID=A0A914CZ80_9BILA